MSGPTGTAAVPALPGGPPGAAGRQAAVLFLTTLGTVMVAVDSTIVILALPTMARELASPLDTVIWTILIYLLITAALTTQAGRLGDVAGRGRIYNLGFAVFTIGSALSGLAPTAEFLVGARAVQAIGGALMFANAGALLTQVFPAERRGRAFGFLVLGWSVGAILGILLGGVITTELGWRYNFFINLPIGAVAVAVGLRSLPPSERQSSQFDLPGFLVFSAALGAISYGAIEFAAYGPDWSNLFYVLVGALLLPVFVALELRSPHPMLDLRELAQRLLGFSLLASLLQAVGYLSVVFLLTMYLQGIRGLSPLDASILLVPGYLVGAVAGPFMGRQVDRVGPRLLATLGLLLMLGAVLAFAQLTPSSWLGWVPAISLVSGFGAGSFFPANTTAIMSQAAPRRLGAISGLRGALTNIGTLLSFVVTLSIASATVSRATAYQVFLGTTDLTGGVAGQFLGGIRAALYGSAAILGAAAVLSWSRGTGGTPAPPRPVEAPA